MQVNRLVSTTDLDHSDWLQWRKLGLGGSDIAAICGLSRYRSALAVYLDKIGELPPIQDNPQMKAGRVLEPVIADWFEEETGIKVQAQNYIFQHPEHKFMLANIDRWVPGQNAGLEIKNTSEYCRKDWYDGTTEVVPTEYQLQANHYMAVMGADRWYVAVLIGGWDFQWRVLERDEALIDSLITIERDFWNGNVVSQIPPQVSYQDTDLLKQLHPISTNSSVELSEAYYGLIKNLIDSEDALEQAKDKHEGFKNQVKQMMGENELAIWQGEKLATWKTDKRGVRTFKIIGGL